MLYTTLDQYAREHPLGVARPVTLTAAQMQAKALAFENQQEAGGGNYRTSTSAFAFYLAQEVAGRAPDATPKVIDLWRNATVPVVQAVAYYLWRVVLRELRHGKVGMCEKAFGLDRTPGQEIVYQICKTSDPIEPVVGSDVPAVDVIQAAYDHYMNGGWHGAYGGKKWGDCTKPLLDYLRGDMGAIMLCDRAWTLQHNTNSVFNKHIMFDLDGSTLSKVLDAQASSSVMRVKNNVGTTAPFAVAALKLLAECGAKGGEEDPVAAETKVSTESYLRAGLHVIPVNVGRTS